MSFISRFCFLVFVFVFSLIILAGCGSNIFKGLNLVPSNPIDSLPVQDQITTLLDNVSPNDTTTYQKVKTLAEQILADPSSTAIQKQNANYYLGVANLGLNGSSIIKIMGALADASSGSSSKTLLSLIEIADSSNVKPSAGDFNNWSTTATSGNDSSFEDRSATRALTNTVAVVDVINDYYVIDTNTGTISGSVSPTTTAKERITSMVDAGVTTYSANATAAADNVSGLSTDDKAQIQKVENGTVEMEKVANALNGTGPAYTGTAYSGKTVTLDSNTSANDPDIEDMVNELFQFN